MVYSKQTWDTTSYVNPTRMNHIEDGIYDVSQRLDGSNVVKVKTGQLTTNQQSYVPVSSLLANADQLKVMSCICYGVTANITTFIYTWNNASYIGVRGSDGSTRPNETFDYVLTYYG